jgi:hypothetical protein
MTKTFTALAAAAGIALAAMAVPTTANADCRGCGVAAGVLGGLAAGAIIGGAIANGPPPPPPYYAPAYGPPPPAAYYDGPPCRVVRERYWDGYGWSFHRVQVCD